MPVPADEAYERALASWRGYRLTEAESACREALAADAAHFDALLLLAEILLTSGAAELAAMLAERALDVRPGDATGRRLLGRALLEAGEVESALAALGDDFAPVAARAASRLAAAGRLDDAARVLARGIALAPGDHELAHLQASLAGKRLARASDGYVVQHFDGFAPTFDERLREIGYTLPELIPAALSVALGAGAPVDVLDAGCGTGMLGKGLRPLARRLIGVDLSPGMLARARDTGFHDDLVEAELVAWLERTPERFGAAVAADVLIYFGAIEALLRGMARVLVAGAPLVLSLETGTHGDWVLETSGRYSHDPRHVAAVLADAGFEATTLEDCALRIQAGEPTPGMIVTARRSEAR